MNTDVVSNLDITIDSIENQQLKKEKRQILSIDNEEWLDEIVN